MRHSLTANVLRADAEHAALNPGQLSQFFDHMRH
jgi:hypothetical protein